MDQRDLAARHGVRDAVNVDVARRSVLSKLRPGAATQAAVAAALGNETV
jgi:hypothetical protein